MADAVGFDWDQANTGHVATNDEMGIDYDVVGGEERWTVIGETDLARVLIVVFTMRGNVVRRVTAYEASGRKRTEYFAMKGR